MSSTALRDPLGLSVSPLSEGLVPIVQGRGMGCEGSILRMETCVRGTANDKDPKWYLNAQIPK